MCKTRSPLLDPAIPVRVKLSALWAALTFCYLYGDYFGLYKPGKLQRMIEGAGPMGPSDQPSLLVVALLLAMPGLMVLLSLTLPARLVRMPCIGPGLLFALFVAITMPGAWWSYLAYSGIEIVLCAIIVRMAWQWPRMDAA